MPATIQRALLSVFDKTDLLTLADFLAARGVEILSTGGTARLLTEHAIPVIEVAEYTGFPEIMAGRVKTLHPRIHGGILGRRGLDESIMDEQEILPIDLIVVNLYPFERKSANPDCNLMCALEEIDIGGPTLLRAGAKNCDRVTVVVDNTDYPKIIAELTETGAISKETRFTLALKAFKHTARYDSAIADYFNKNNAKNQIDKKEFPTTLKLSWQLQQVLRYGENPHQTAAFYVEPGCCEPGVATARQLQGKALSYNNLADADAAIECVKQFDTAPACVIVKHANPCGVAIGPDLLTAYDRAYQTDSESAFGGIIAFNQELDAQTVQAILQRQFVEVIIAPQISEAAQLALAVKPNVRVLSCGAWLNQPAPRYDYKKLNGGLLIQDADLDLIENLRVVTRRAPTAQEQSDLLFTWRVAKFVKSNAIVYGSAGRTIGIGAGQMSRVNSARIASFKAEQAGLKITGAVMASDAFFPFRDSIDQAAQAGISAIIQPGGSMRDQEVIAAADEHQLAMIFTGMRHFRH